MVKRFFTNEWVILAAVLANSSILFTLGYDEMENNKSLLFADHLFTIFFVVEAIVKISYWGKEKYFSSGWNRFDFGIVILSLPSLAELLYDFSDVDISFLLMFRILRVIRIFRFLRIIPNIKQLIAGVRRAFRASIFVFVALLIYNLLLAVLTCYMFKDAAPEYFGDPMISFYTIFQVFTLEGWDTIPKAIAESSEPWLAAVARIYFVVIVLTGGMFGFSIVNAIFVDEMVIDNTDELEAKIDDMNLKMDMIMKAQGLKYIEPEEKVEDDPET